jgi:hypothetical protein
MSLSWFQKRLPEEEVTTTQTRIVCPKYDTLNTIVDNRKLRNY